MAGNLGKSSKKSKSKKKEKLVFAKDKKQAITAMVVLGLFLLNSLYSIIKYQLDQMPRPAKTPAQSASDLSQDSLANQNPDVLNPEQASNTQQNPNMQQDANNIYSQTLNLQGNSSVQKPQVSTLPTDDVEIITKKPKKFNGKMVSVVVANSGRSNPFLPSSEDGVIPSFGYLPPPPESLPSNSDASKIITTTISGILYDKYSPSAIINISGTDYLVKRGDVINRYKILSITKDQVLVQLGKNTYKAGVGELLSQTNLSSTVANLNKKFGGNDVSINVRKKGY